MVHFSGPSVMHFRPRPLQTAATAAGLVVLIGLGRWQLRRDAERNAGRDRAVEVAHLPALGTADLDGPEGDLAWRRIEVIGHFVDPPLVEEGRPWGHRVGYGAWQAFQVEGGPRLLVDRGWLPADGGPAAVASVVPRAGEPTRLAGQVRAFAGGAGGDVAGEGQGATTSGRGGGAFPPGSQREMRARVAPGSPAVYVVQGPALGDGDGPDAGRLPVQGYVPVPPPDRTSLHYALQWFAAAAALSWVWLAASARRRRADQRT